MKDKIKLIVTSIFIFLLYFYFSYIVEFILKFFNLDITNFSFLTKVIFIYLFDLIPFSILILIYRKSLVEDFNILKNKYKEYADKYIRYWILGLFLMSILNVIISAITSSNISNNEEAIRSITDILPMYSILSTCIFAPITEELAYRKTLNNIFINKKLSIVMGFLLFGLAHVIGTYETPLDLLYILPYGVFGGIFMYIYTDSKNIWSTISIHFIHNTIMMIVYFVSKLV